MSEGAAPDAGSGAQQGVVQGPGLVVRDRSSVTTTQTLVPTADPLISKDHLTELGSMLGLIGGLWIYIERKIEKKRRTDKDALDARLKPLEDRIDTFKPKDQIAADKAQLERDIADLKHDLKNAETSIAGLDKLRQETDQWRASVNTTLANYKEGQERIEKMVEKNHRETMDAIMKLMNKGG